MKNISENFEKYELGDFWVSNNTWNRREMVNGIDFWQSIAFDPFDLTKNITFSWDWGQDAGRMLAYPEVIVGYKPWDQAGSTNMVSRIDRLSKFEVSVDVTLKGNTDLYTTSYEIWTTDEPLGDKTTINTEVMVWTHGAEHGDSSSIVGQYSQGKYKFDIVLLEDHGGIGGNFWDLVILLPRKDYQDVTLDMKDILDTLAERKLISSKDYISGYEFGSEVCGGKGNWTINNISHAFSTLESDNGDNTLVGTSSKDLLSGKGGDDVISGAKGDDRIIGGAGDDKLTGGAGRDQFIFKQHSDDIDEIVDFVKGRDSIVLSSDVFEVLGSAHDGMLVEVGAEDSNSCLIYDKSSGTLYYDADGAGSEHERQAVVTLANGVALTWSDIVFV